MSFHWKLAGSVEFYLQRGSHSGQDGSGHKYGSRKWPEKTDQARTHMRPPGDSHRCVLPLAHLLSLKESVYQPGSTVLACQARYLLSTRTLRRRRPWYTKENLKHVQRARYRSSSQAVAQ